MPHLARATHLSTHLCEISSSHGGPDNGGSMYLWNVGRQLFCTAEHPRRQIWTSYSPPWKLEISHVLLDFVHIL